MNFQEQMELNIKNGMSVAEIVNAFEALCRQFPDDQAMILFETGTFSFQNHPMFYFSLVRQIPQPEGDEYIQSHVDIIFQPDRYNKEFYKAVWDISIKEDIFAFIRKSAAYEYAVQNPYDEIEVFTDET